MFVDLHSRRAFVSQVSRKLHKRNLGTVRACDHSGDGVIPSPSTGFCLGADLAVGFRWKDDHDAILALVIDILEGWGRPFWVRETEHDPEARIRNWLTRIHIDSLKTPESCVRFDGEPWKAKTSDA